MFTTLAEASPVVTALTAGASSAATDGLSAISSVLPIAMSVMGTILVIRLGIKVFNTVTHKG